MKLPNGYGSVVKLSGNRRKPFAVRKTTGFNDKGYPIYVILGYTETREQELLLLADYNKSPWDVEGGKVTFEELYSIWAEKRAVKLKDSSRASLKSAYKHCEPLYKLKYAAIKSFDMQDVIDNCGRGYSTQGAIKNLFGHLDRFAMELDIISKANSDLISAVPIPETSKGVFTAEQIARLWEYRDGITSCAEGFRDDSAVSNEVMIDLALILIYSGFRISEALNLTLSDIFIGEGNIAYFVGGVKTDAGRDRIVPIHSLLLPVVCRRITASKSGFLFETAHGSALVSASPTFRSAWNAALNALGMSHTPHECRHTFRSRLDSAGANKVCIDRLMGHKSQGTGERVYTHKTLSELKSNIELVTR